MISSIFPINGSVIASNNASLALINAIAVPTKYKGFDSFPMTNTNGKAPKLNPNTNSKKPIIEIGNGLMYIIAIKLNAEHKVAYIIKDKRSLTYSDNLANTGLAIPSPINTIEIKLGAVNLSR